MTPRHLLGWLVLVLATGAPAGAQTPSSDISSYALFAFTELRNRALVVTDGNLGVNAPGGRLYSAFGLHAPLSDVVASRVRIPDSECRTLFTSFAPLGRCGAPAFFTSPFADGAAVNRACGFPTRFPACGGRDVTVENGKVERLAAGQYNRIVVNGGVLPGRIIMLGGDYSFCSLKVARNADLLFDSASQVFIDGDADLGGMDFTGSGGGDLGAPDVRFLVSGTDVRIRPRSRVFGRLCAPNAKLRVGWGSKLFGTFVAQTIRTDRITVRAIPAGTTPPSTTTTTTTRPPTTSTASTTTTTTTTVTTSTGAPRCGDGRLDAGETCDPPGASVCPSPGGAFLACDDDCTCPRPADVRCCLPPSAGFGRCELLKPAECAQQGGVNLGIGSCEPDPCGSVPTTTTTTSITTTTAAPRCGDGRLDPGETCDPPGSAACPSPGGAFLTCDDDCTCPRPVDIRCCLPPSAEFGRCELLKPSECAQVGGINIGLGACEPDPCASVPTTTITTITTTTTGPTTTTTRPSTTTTRPATTTTTTGGNATTTTTRPTGPTTLAEVCGNCLDDDDNGLTDFEDPACCTGSQRFEMGLRNGRIRPRGATSAVKVASSLALAGLSGIDPLREDLFVQIRAETNGDELLCARVPATRFTRKHGAYRFWDSGQVPSAMGLADVTVKVRRSGAVSFRAHGKRVQLSGATAGSIHLTVGFRDPAAVEGASRCSATIRTFRTSGAGALLAP